MPSPRRTGSGSSTAARGGSGERVSRVRADVCATVPPMSTPRFSHGWVPLNQAAKAQVAAQQQKQAAATQSASQQKAATTATTQATAAQTKAANAQTAAAKKAAAAKATADRKTAAQAKKDATAATKTAAQQHALDVVKQSDAQLAKEAAAGDKVAIREQKRRATASHKAAAAAKAASKASSKASAASSAKSAAAQSTALNQQFHANSGAKLTAAQAEMVYDLAMATGDAEVMDLAGKWRHGWIPLDAVAVAVKAKRYHGGGESAPKVSGPGRGKSRVGGEFTGERNKKGPAKLPDRAKRNGGLGAKPEASPSVYRGGLSPNDAVRAKRSELDQHAAAGSDVAKREIARRESRRAAAGGKIGGRKEGAPFTPKSEAPFASDPSGNKITPKDDGVVTAAKLASTDSQIAKVDAYQKALAVPKDQRTAEQVRTAAEAVEYAKTLKARKTHPVGAPVLAKQPGIEKETRGHVTGHTDAGMLKVQYSDRNGVQTVGTFNPAHTRVLTGQEAATHDFEHGSATARPGLKPDASNTAGTRTFKTLKQTRDEASVRGHSDAAIKKAVTASVHHQIPGELRSRRIGTVREFVSNGRGSGWSAQHAESDAPHAGGPFKTKREAVGALVLQHEAKHPEHAPNAPKPKDPLGGPGGPGDRPGGQMTLGQARPPKVDGPQTARKASPRVAEYKTAREAQDRRFEAANGSVGVHQTDTQEYRDYFGVGDHAGNPVEKRLTLKDHLANTAKSPEEKAHAEDYKSGVALGLRHGRALSDPAADTSQHDAEYDKLAARHTTDSFGSGYSDGVAAGASKPPRHPKR